ncbi:hypothetical protein EHS25_001474 [Saitozyma podzolica]|uniref:F-box domain-containing protein n=1 Tax=Saitozyma podzolica TaxID=1890683 RepID=A0A427YGD7_9TREE|nr:hypothetical protein EHS25_001474 [Saitozyma podzolica]
MLDIVPPEVLSRIALHVSAETSLPPVNLLLTSHAIHSSLCASNNPNLYASIFRSSFDVSAAQRRVGSLNAVDLTRELRRRMGALARLGWMVRTGDVRGVGDDQLWVIYVMLIENDGKNLQHLLAPRGEVHLPTFLQLYHEQHLLAAAVEPGFPAETVGRSLAIWIAWLLSGYARTPEERDERLFVLRPYVFAAQQYEPYFAPWTMHNLPLSISSPTMPKSNPFIADLSPKTRRVEIEWYGRQLELSPPILTHAAILRFFTKKTPAEIVVAESDPSGPAPLAPIMAVAAAQAAAMGGLALPGLNPTDMAMDIDDISDDSSESSGVMDRLTDLVSDSQLHDRDFERLRRCFDPLTCLGMPRTAWRGMLDGCWEGNFSFFEFEAFREMVAGQSRALYEGPFGEQAQVWKLKETYVRPIGSARGNKGKGKASAQTEAQTGAKSPPGLPLNGPMTNAGFPTDQPSSTSAGLASAAAEAATVRETIQRQVEAIPGFEVVPDDELDEMLSHPDEEAGLEMLLTGTGHSAWGRFILKGRVRAWDGMASLVKEYAPDSRGKWIYRGYVLAGDVFVGRWRDTFTPEAFVGYEGTFILNRR